MKALFTTAAAAALLAFGAHGAMAQSNNATATIKITATVLPACTLDGSLTGSTITADFS